MWLCQFRDSAIFLRVVCHISQIPPSPQFTPLVWTENFSGLSWAFKERFSWQTGKWGKGACDRVVNIFAWNTNDMGPKMKKSHGWEGMKSILMWLPPLILFSSVFLPHHWQQMVSFHHRLQMLLFFPGGETPFCETLWKTEKKVNCARRIRTFNFILQ